MKDRTLFLEIVRFLHYIIGNDYYCRRSIVRQQDFSRKTKMSFSDYIYAIIRRSHTSLHAGIHMFFEAYKEQQLEYSKQAFSKGRQRIKPEAFQELFLATVLKFYEKAELASWHGYHLFGIDGTRLNLPCTKELKEKYHSQVSQGAEQVQALVSCVYDLLNGIIVDVRFAACNSSERDAAESMIQSFYVKQVEKPVFIMDRGYPSAELIMSIMDAGHKFVMRCPTTFIRKMRLPEEDNIIEHKFTKSKKPIKIRLVKVRLDNGIEEYLVTNLFESDISIEDFKWLYHQRWGIETKYDDVKNVLEIEDFSGYSEIAILQDFYATLMLANLAGALQYELHEEIEAAHSSPENKYAYKMNVTETIGALKRNVVNLLMASTWAKREYLFWRMVKTLKNAVVPVRPGRSFIRTKKHKTANYCYNDKRID